MMERYWRGAGNTVVVALLLTGAETSLLYLLTAELTGAFSRAPLPWPYLWAAGLVAFLLPRALHGAPSWLYVPSIVFAVAASTALCAYLSGYSDQRFWSPGWLQDAAGSLAAQPNHALHSVPLLALTLLALWWRQLSRETPGSDAAGTLFRLGPIPVAALALTGLLGWGTGGPEAGLLTQYIAAFFVLCLLALAYTRWMETPERGAGRLASLAVWMSSSLLPVLIALGVTTVVTALVFGTVAPALTAAGRAGLTVIVWVLVAVTAALGVIVFVIIWGLRWLYHALFGGVAAPYRPPQAAEADRRLREALANGLHLPPAVFWTLLLVAALLALYLLTRYRPRRESLAGTPVTRESVWVRPDLRAGLGSLYRRIQKRLPTHEQDPLQAMLADPEWRHTAEVRRAYRDVEGLYGRAGRRRLPHQTVREHSQTEPSDALSELASMYETARYSARPARAEEARRAISLQTAVRQELAHKATPRRSSGGDQQDLSESG